MKPVFIDSNIFMYAAGAEHPNKEPCVQFLLSVTQHPQPESVFFSNAEVLQEILHRYRAIGRNEIAHRVLEFVVSIPIHFLPIQLETLLEANRVLKEAPHLSTRDALHLASMTRAGLRRILSFDQDFDSVPWVERMEP